MEGWRREGSGKAGRRADAMDGARGGGEGREEAEGRQGEGRGGEGRGKE